VVAGQHKDKKMKKLCFISSPYSHDDKEVVEENFRRVTRFAAELNKQGIVAISPITYGHTLVKFVTMPTDWDFWRDFCLSLLVKCDEMIVYQMPGWDKSRGIEEEMSFARDHNIPIKYKKYEE
jgi:hypothetical protein